MTGVRFVRGDITTGAADAIVNAADRALAGDAGFVLFSADAVSALERSRDGD
jgi:O-acetyl-ADP-ribose deacetylase (regulator of RNase III)